MLNKSVAASNFTAQGLMKKGNQRVLDFLGFMAKWCDLADVRVWPHVVETLVFSKFCASLKSKVTGRSFSNLEPEHLLFLRLRSGSELGPSGSFKSPHFIPIDFSHFLIIST